MKLFKRLTSALLAVAFSLTTIVPTFAEETIYQPQLPEQVVSGGNATVCCYNWRNLTINGYTLSNGYTMTPTSWFAISTDAPMGGRAMYCLEPCAPLHGGTQMYETTRDILDYSPYVVHNKTTAKQKERLIGIIMSYGCQYPYNGWPDITQFCNYTATWCLIHEVVLEERDANFNYIGPAPGAMPEKSIYNWQDAASNARFDEYYNSIANSVQQYLKVPSFADIMPETAPTYTLDQYDASSNRQYVDLVDTNNCLGQYHFSSSDAAFSVNGNVLREYSSSSATQLTTIESNESRVEALIYWGASGSQAMCQSTDIPDPVRAYFYVQPGLGNLQINKTCEEFDPITQTSVYTTEDADGKNFSATDYGSYSYSGSTNESGQLSLNNIHAQNYTVTETGTPVQYVQPANQTVNVANGQTTQVNVANTLKKGKVGLIKKCTYYGNMRVKGAVYGVYRTSDNALIQTLTTDADYVWSNLLPYGDYYLKEITPPTYYAPNTTTYPFSITEDGQQVKITVWNTPYSDVYPEFIEPNSDYREGTEIVASYYIHNDSIADRADIGTGNTSPLTVRFRAIDEDGNVVCEQTQEVVVPKFTENLVYFHVDVPEDAEELSFTCSIDMPGGVIETNTENNAVSEEFEVQEVPTSDTPDTKFENKPKSFNVPNANSPVPTGDLTRSVKQDASWQQWVYENHAFALNTYGATLSTTQGITPDAANPSALLLENGMYSAKSGYGISYLGRGQLVKNGTALENADACTNLQHANAYFPEFSYEFSKDSYQTLAMTSPGVFEFQENPYTITSDGKQDFRRVHFTPLWYPDGDYTMQTYLYDSWTPAGMLSQAQVVSPINIEGDMYDDWYISHQQQEE